MSIADLRREYTQAGLLERDVDANPFKQFALWFQQAVDAGLTEVNAMTLATAMPDGKPSARIVLLKGFDEHGFTFFTNYESRKAQELTHNPTAALVFFWKELERQVCITGQVTTVSRQESDLYFQTRPLGSQLGAWSSKQSEVIPDRSCLEQRLSELEAKYRGTQVPLPPFWGGYRLSPDGIEFWQGRPNRLHDRIRYSRRPGQTWLIERLSP